MPIRHAVMHFIDKKPDGSGIHSGPGVKSVERWHGKAKAALAVVGQRTENDSRAALVDLPAGGGLEVQFDQVAAVRVIGALAHQSSLPTGLPARSASSRFRRR